MSIVSNLYPPIMMDTLPSFVRTQSCRIYFSLSAYNNKNDIKNVQVSIVDQATNRSAFNTVFYPNLIKVTDLLYDSSVVGDYSYYVNIDPTDLANGSFQINHIYKVQLRFTNNRAKSFENTAKWFSDNKDNFSEWSKVCLIKGIEQPQIKLKGFDSDDPTEESVIMTSLVEVSGKLFYDDPSESEYLKNYYIEIYRANDLNNPVYKTDLIYTDQYAVNEIYYETEYTLVDNTDYVLVVNYTTSNLYSNSASFDFKSIQHQLDPLAATITAEVDEENGRIKVNVLSTDHEPFLGNITIRRSSSANNFSTWEDVKTTTYTVGTELNLVWYDETIESGVWYKYAAQKRSTRGDRGAIIQTANPVMCILDYIFLTRDDCQLKIKFNPSLNEFKYNVAESQQQTIGGKFPYVKRNGNNYFRSFPIGGLISSFIDTSNWYDPHFYDGEFHPEDNEIGAFTTKEEIYGESLQLYNQYNETHNISEYQDYIYERKFREKVYDFLYKHNVKLFRSATEGNILVKLMNIDFQPVETLGRRLYSFTANAVEIDEATIKNYNKYGVQITGTYKKYINYKHQTIGQIQGVYGGGDGNILDIITQKYQGQKHEGFELYAKDLSWVRIEITSEPYAYVDTGSKIEKAPYYYYGWAVTPDFSGYRVIINGKERLISANGILEIEGEDISITEIAFPDNVDVTIDFIANLEEIESVSRESINYYSKRVGQLYNTFRPTDLLIQKISNKYYVENDKYSQYMLRVTRVKIESDPGVVVYIQEDGAAAPLRHVLENGFLDIGDANSNITNLYFNGVHLIESEDPYIVREYEYTSRSGQYSDVSEITDPVTNGVYNVGEGKKIYYHEQWFDFDPDTEDVQCPVNGMVDYYCDVVKGVY